jgi:aspartyl-tRNA(Asn)/glutamyl-tRNA(Gln) amidotransferase subunit A
MPVTAPVLGTTQIDFGGRTEAVRAVMLRLTQLFDITGHPAITIPIPPVTAPHLPVGFQLVGRRSQTAVMLAVARALEGTLRT